LKKENKSKETRDNILKSASVCFSEIGYHQTDVNKICENANITKGAFYYHFSSKQELFLILLEKWMEDVASHLDVAVKGSKSVLELISSIPVNFSPVFESAGKQLPVFLELYVKSILNPELKKNILKAYNKFIVFFQATIKKGIEDGSIKKIDPEDGAKILFSLCIGMIMQGLLNPEDDDWIRLTNKSLVMLLK